MKARFTHIGTIRHVWTRHVEQQIGNQRDLVLLLHWQGIRVHPFLHSDLLCFWALCCKQHLVLEAFPRLTAERPAEYRAKNSTKATAFPFFNPFHTQFLRPILALCPLIRQYTVPLSRCPVIDEAEAAQFTLSCPKLLEHCPGSIKRPAGLGGGLVTNCFGAGIGGALEGFVPSATPFSATVVFLRTNASPSSPAVRFISGVNVTAAPKSRNPIPPVRGIRS